MAELDLDQLCINTIRFLSVDAVEKAGSGHPGTPMGAAVAAYVLWDRYLRHNPSDPGWINRDRFVLSAGHASMLLYSLLHLTGYALTLVDLKNFRQWGSKTPGHPEYGLTPGVETTTGPLGQGFANAVGMAVAECWLSQRFNRPGFKIIDHYTYALVSDGDMQEGISSEAASLAGVLRLAKLVFLYDSNGVQQDGLTRFDFSENVAGRYRAYGWNVVGPIDGMDPGAVDSALKAVLSQDRQPSLIICRTIIGFGSPNKAGTSAAHGEPLGEAEVRLSKENLGWKYSEPFSVPAEALSHLRLALDRGRFQQSSWQTLFEEYAAKYPQLAGQFQSEQQGFFPEGWEAGLEELLNDADKPTSTRDISGLVLNRLAQKIPNLIGGAADLAGSTRTLLKGLGNFGEGDYAGRNIRFGLREHAMAAMSSGMALHGGVIPFAASFLIFSDYMRPAIRLAALMKLRVIYVFSHDSIGLGEDGPTHQPIEQLMGLRSIPNLLVIRPADPAETLEAWKVALKNQAGPTVLVLTRQPAPILDRKSLASAAGLERGGYVVWESKGFPEVILIASGSEVYLALEAGKILEHKGLHSRVVSMPSWSLFDIQTKEYRDNVLPPEVKGRLSVEAGTSLGWEHYVGSQGISIGINHFGSSAPGKTLMEHYGFTAAHIVDTALKMA
jgi:transketolase